MKKFVELIIKTDPPQPELLPALMWDHNPEGIQEEDDCIKIYFMHTEDYRLAEFEGMLENMKSEGLINSFNIEEKYIEQKNWNEEFEKTLEVMKITDNITVKPSFLEYEPASDELVITIEPKMSFGTGRHETTKLMLKALDKYRPEGMKVLDVGSGSGILTVGAAMLGASYALGIDNDDWCLPNAEENIRLNNVESKARALTAEIADVADKDFDMILANILADVLTDIAADIYSRTNRGGLLILSGLLKEDGKDIIKKYTSLGCKLVDEFTLNEWIALTFRK